METTDETRAGGSRRRRQATNPTPAPMAASSATSVGTRGSVRKLSATKTSANLTLAGATNATLSGTSVGRSIRYVSRLIREARAGLGGGKGPLWHGLRAR